MSGGTRYAAREDVQWLLVEGEVVLLDPRSSTYYSLNEAGGVVWDALARGTTEAEAAAAVQRQFGIAEDLAVSDVRRLLAELEEQHLVTVEP